MHSDREQFRDAIDLAYEQTGVMVQAIEKDYYVTMLLRLLAQKILNLAKSTASSSRTYPDLAVTTSRWESIWNRFSR